VAVNSRSVSADVISASSQLQVPMKRVFIRCSCCYRVLAVSRARCQLPYAHGPTITVRVDRQSLLPGISKLTSVNRTLFYINPPLISTYFPVKIPDRGGILTILGQSFGSRGTIAFHSRHGCSNSGLFLLF
jgi:hypothetical protein